MEGIDVHGSKGLVNWNALKQAGISFAFVKATEGATFLDNRIIHNLREARAAGILVGPYHYGRPDTGGGSMTDAQTEADFFCRIVLNSGWDKLRHARPVLDIEVGSGGLSAWSDAFCKRVEQRLGVTPIIYSYTYFIRSHLTASYLARYPLWLANYGPNDGRRHYVSPGEGPWKAWTVHQYTSNGRLLGVSGDVDRNFTASLDPLRAFVAPEETGAAMWRWIKWWRGHAEYKAFGPRNPAVRPDVPTRIPAEWWARLRQNLGIRPPGGGGGTKSQ